MKTLRLSVILLAMFSAMNCSSKDKLPEPVDTMVNGKRIIKFAGYDWVVESGGSIKQGPGPNFFSNSTDNVWLDKEGRLHLRITNRGGKWYCAKVTLVNSFSYGRYIFRVDSRVDSLDKNVVAGLFTYKNDSEEIDIEFSKWSVDGNMDSQFAIQPSDKTQNKRRYFLNLASEKSTHWFNWQPDRIDFASYQGHSAELPSAADIIQKWSYTGTDIPPDVDEKAKINLWLFRGNPPSDLKETEMIISGFSIQ